MGRLRAEFLERVESFVDRVVQVSRELERQRVTHRIVDQVLASGTSVGANIFEADEAMSRPDFVKCMSIAAKELAETRFWLRLIARNQWVKRERLGPLLTEADELRRVIGTMIRKSRPRVSQPRVT